MRRYSLWRIGVHSECTHVQHTFDAVAPAGVDEPAGKLHVYVLESVAGSGVFIQDAGQVDDHVAAREVGVQVRRKMDVRLDHFARRHHQQGPRSTAPPREDSGRATFSGERSHQVAADEAREPPRIAIRFHPPWSGCLCARACSFAAARRAWSRRDTSTRAVPANPPMDDSATRYRGYSGGPGVQSRRLKRAFSRPGGRS